MLPAPRTGPTIQKVAAVDGRGGRRAVGSPASVAKEFDHQLGRWVPKGDIARREQLEKLAQADKLRAQQVAAQQEAAAKAQARAARPTELAKAVAVLDDNLSKAVQADHRAGLRDMAADARRTLAKHVVGSRYCAYLDDGQVKTVADAWDLSPAEMRVRALQTRAKAATARDIGMHDNADHLEATAKTLTAAADHLDRLARR